MTSQDAPAPSPDGMAPRLAGKTFVFGNIPGWKKNEYRRLIQHQGGAVVEKVTNQLDFLLFEGPQPSPPKARKVQRLNAQGAGIQCIDTKQFFGLFAPNVDEAVALLKSGKRGVQRWNDLRCIRKPPDEQLRHGLHWNPLDEQSPVPMPSFGAIDLRQAQLRG